MSYQVHITRAKFWAENRGQEISVEEWLEYIQSDTDLVHDEPNGPYFAVMKGSGSSGDPWLDWSDGNVNTGSPGRALQEKLLQVADQLGAIVQGDDGELYERIADFPDSIERRHRSTKGRRGLPAYKRRDIFWKFIIYGSIAAAIIVANVFDFW